MAPRAEASRDAAKKTAERAATAPPAPGARPDVESRVVLRTDGTPLPAITAPAAACSTQTMALDAGLNAFLRAHRLEHCSAALRENKLHDLELLSFLTIADAKKMFSRGRRHCAEQLWPAPPGGPRRAARPGARGHVLREGRKPGRLRGRDQFRSRPGGGPRRREGRVEGAHDRVGGGVAGRPERGEAARVHGWGSRQGSGGRGSGRR